VCVEGGLSVSVSCGLKIGGPPTTPHPRLAAFPGLASRFSEIYFGTVLYLFSTGEVGGRGFYGGRQGWIRNE
jgi:hypothetical protein